MRSATNRFAEASAAVVLADFAEEWDRVIGVNPIGKQQPVGTTVD